MTPYYASSNVTLYCGDCMDVEVPCDLIVTDPPYGKDLKIGRISRVVKGDDDIEGTMYRLTHSIKSLRRGRHVYIFKGSLPLESLPLCGITEIIWDKGVMGLGDLSLPWGAQHENITFAVYETSKSNREKGFGGLTARLRKGSVIRSTRPISRGAKDHPTQKPVDLLQQLIESSSIMGETVFDPFAGVGSTLIAAAREGRIGVGVEFEERYCEIAARKFEEMSKNDIN